MCIVLLLIKGSFTETTIKFAEGKDSIFYTSIELCKLFY